MRARIIPGLFEILDGRVEVSRIRDVEIEDLLGREPVRLDQDALHAFLGGKTVMVTGAGGSIGSELARQAARYGAGTCCWSSGPSSFCSRSTAGCARRGASWPWCRWLPTPPTGSG